MKKHRINSDNHGNVSIPVTDYLELLEVYRAFNERCFLVMEWSGSNIYAIDEKEVVAKLQGQIEDLRTHNDAIHVILNKREQVAKRRWQFWK